MAGYMVYARTYRLTVTCFWLRGLQLIRRPPSCISLPLASSYAERRLANFGIPNLISKIQRVGSVINEDESIAATSGTRKSELFSSDFFRPAEKITVLLSIDCAASC